VRSVAAVADARVGALLRVGVFYDGQPRQGCQPVKAATAQVGSVGLSVTNQRLAVVAAGPCPSMAVTVP